MTAKLLFLSLICSCCLFSIVFPAMGQTSNFADKFDRPIKLSTFQPLPGFIESLKKFDARRGLLDFNNGWYSFDKGDVWTLFILDETDRAFLPPLAKKVLDEGYDGQDEIIYIADVNVTNDRSILFNFVFMNNFADANLDRILCRVSTLTYGVIDGWKASRINSAQEKCDNLAKQ